MKTYSLSRRVLCALLTLFSLTLSAFSQGYVVERDGGKAWILVDQATAGTKIAQNLGTIEAPGSSTVTFRIRNTSNSTKNFNGAIIGVNNNEGDFTTNGITPASGGLGGESIPAGGNKEFTVTYTPTCPSDFKPLTLVGGSNTDSFNFNLSGSAADSNLRVASFPSAVSKAATTIPDDATAATGLRTDFGEVAVGGGGVPQESELAYFGLLNFSGEGDGQATLGFSDAKITGDARNDFTLSGLPDGTLESKENALESFTISFNPSEAGVRDATFSVKVTDADVGDNGVYSFRLRGEGTGTTSFTIEGSADVSPRSYQVITDEDTTPRPNDGTQFAPIILPEDSPGNLGRFSYFRITNTGDVPLNDYGAFVTDNSGPEGAFNFFTTPDPSSINLDPGESQVYRLDFFTSEGRESDATVLFARNDGGKGVQSSFAVRGRGTAPEIQVISQTNAPILQPANGQPTPASGAIGTVFTAAIGSNDTKSFTIRNIGNRELFIDSGSIQGGDGDFSFSGISNTNVFLGETETLTLTITYTPTRTDTQNETFRIVSDDFNEDNFRFALRGNPVGVPELRMRGFGFAGAPVDIDDTPGTPDQNIVMFGEVTPPDPETGGDPDSLFFRIKNDGTGALEITDIRALGAGYSIFPLTFPFTIAPDGATSDFQVGFAPATSGEDQRGRIQVFHNADNLPNPYIFRVTGDAFGPISAVYGGPAQNVYIERQDRSPEEIDGTLILPAQTPGLGTLTREFRLQNLGNRPLRGRYISDAPGSDQRHFSVPTDNTLDIPAGGSTTIQVTFAPELPGYLETIIAILPTGSLNPGYNFSVGGFGSDPDNAADIRVTATPTSTELLSGAAASGTAGTDYGTVQAGSKASLNITLTNTDASDPLTIASVGIESPGGKFTLTSPPQSASIAPLASASFGVEFMSFDPGEFGATVTINSSDPDEGNYVLNFAARVAGTPSNDPLALTVTSREGKDLLGALTGADGKSYRITTSPNLSGPWLLVPNYDSVEVGPLRLEGVVQESRARAFFRAELE